MQLGKLISELQKLELKFGSEIEVVTSHNEGFISEIDIVEEGKLHIDEFDDCEFIKNVKNSEVDAIYIN